MDAHLKHAASSEVNKTTFCTRFCRCPAVSVGCNVQLNGCCLMFFTGLCFSTQRDSIKAAVQRSSFWSIQFMHWVEHTLWIILGQTRKIMRTYLSSVFNKSRFAVLACISAASLRNVPCDYLNSRLKTINKQTKSGRKLSFSPSL